MKIYIYILVCFTFLKQTKANSLGDLIPDNTASHIAVQSGPWSLASTWNTNTVPTDAAIVLIPKDISVSYRQNSNAHIFALKVAGNFTMTQSNAASTTKLIVDTFVGTMTSTIHIHASGINDGTIEVVFKPFDIEQQKNVGTQIYPLVWNTDAKTYFFDKLTHYKVTHKITTVNNVDRFDDAADGNSKTSLSQFSSTAIDDGPGVYGRSSWDPEQLSLGLVTMGKIQVLGKEKTTKLKLRLDALKNQKKMNFNAAPDGWNIGDELLVTSGGNQNSNARGVDEAVVASISGSQVTTIANLTFNHEGRATENLHCYVGNLSRNIQFSSADISEVSRRGHVMAMHNPIDVQFRFALFKNLGRTDKSRLADDFIYDKWLDPVVFTSKLSALGQECMQLKKQQANKITNSRGRYSIHLHRTGAVNDTKAAQVEGNVVWGNPGWAITHHDSHAVIKNNIVYDVNGAGIVSEAGNETGFWDDNLVVKIAKARPGVGDAFTAVSGEDYFDPDFYHSALFYDDYLFRGEGLAMRGRAIVCRNNIISDANFGVGITNINPVKTNLFRVDPEALAVLRPNHKIDHFPLDVDGYSKEGDGVLPVEVALLFEKTTVINSNTGLNSIERDMAVNHESRSVFDGFNAWGTNTGLQLTYQADYSFKDVYISGKNSNSRGIDMWKHSSNHSFENIKIEDCGSAIRVSKVVGLGTDYLNLKTRNNGFTQWTFINYSEKNVTEHYELELDTQGATYTYTDHPDNIVYLSSDDKIINRPIAFTLTDNSDLAIDLATGDLRFEIDGYISDSAGSYNYGVKSAWAQGELRFDYPERIYEFASQIKLEQYLTEKGVYKDALNGDQLYFIINESVPDRLTFDYKTFPIRINILNAPSGAPYSNATYESEVALLPKTSLISLNGTAKQSSTSTIQKFEDVTIETPASRAIDGNTNGRLHVQFYQRNLVPVGSSSYTNVQSEPWWELDLGEEQSIESIEVWGTQKLNGTAKGTVSDDFKNFYVLIDDEPFGDVNLATAQINALAYYHRGATGSRLFSQTGISRKARYVRIMGEGTRQLSLAEVSVLGKANGPQYCDYVEDNGVVVNGDFECGYNSDWELAVSGAAEATFFNGDSESFEGNISTGVQVETGDNYNKVVLKNKPFIGNLKNKKLKLSAYAKSATVGASFRFQVSITNGSGTTNNETSPVVNVTSDYQKYEYDFDILEDTQSVLVKLNLGKTEGTYYFDNVSSELEDILSVLNEELETDRVIFFPNPVATTMNIKNYKSIKNLQLYDLNGQLLLNTNLTSNEIDVSFLKTGFYLIKAVFNNGKVAIEKLIKVND